MTEAVSPDAIDGRFVPARRDTVASVEIDGEVVLYDEESGAMHLLNHTAGILWQAFDGSIALDDLIAELSEAFAAPVEVVGADVLRATREMGEQGVLEGVRSDDGSD